jgi:hypothetical protein
MLRAKKPEAVKKRLKALFYGKAGVGKTMAAIQFPRPYLIDTEHGAENDQYIDLLEKSGGVIFSTTDFDEMIKEIITLLSIKHEYKTLIIDPLTIVYNDLLEKSAAMLSKDGKDGTEFGRHYNLANKKIKHLLNLLLRLDMNVIITAHSKNEYGAKLELIGQTFDCYKKLDYLFDIVFRIEKFGKERRAYVDKSRIKEFPENEFFPFSYEEISKRYGIDMLEKDAVPEVLASQEQVLKLKSLIALLNIQEDVTDKWKAKANAETFNEMTQDAIQKCIEFLLSKVTTGEENV